MIEPNEVTVFSNGIADFRRRFQVPRGGERVITLAYRRDHIGDVLGSLNVFGPVRIVKPPAYRHTNANAPTLAISPDDAIPGLLRSFSGAKVRVWTRGGGDDGVAGTILGLDKLDEVVRERVVERAYLGLYGDDRKLRRISLEDITDYRFEADADNAEIAKALSRNYQAIKPESTFVDLTLGTLDGATEDAEAIVQGVIPLSAWKMTYRIEAGPDGSRLEGLAIVDNNTDEDWANFLVSVVTGEPNTFATDLAVAKVPRRRLVNLVPESAIGGFQAAEGLTSPPYQAPPSLKGATPPRRSAQFSGRKEMGGGYGAAPVAMAMDFEAVDSMMLEAPAGRDEAEASSVGEFQVFRSKAPVDVPARSSALVPMFSRGLGDARTILIYNEREMPTHPFRAIRLVNDTGLNLNKGTCTVFREGVFSGQGILDNCKPGEVRVVPHSLELGVLVLKQSDPVGGRLVRIKVSDGLIVEETAENLRTTYLLKNKLDEPFTFVLEYNQVLPDSEMKAAGPEVAEREKTAAGIRFEFLLAPGAGPTAVTIEETRPRSQQMHLNEQTLAMLGETKRLTDDPRIIEAMKVQESIDRAKRELARQQALRKTAVDKQARVQQLVATARGGGGGQQANEWMKDLGETEKAIRDLDEKVIPGLAAELDLLQRRIGEALKAIRATWEDPVAPKA